MRGAINVRTIELRMPSDDDKPRNLLAHSHGLAPSQPRLFSYLTSISVTEWVSDGSGSRDPFWRFWLFILYRQLWVWGGRAGQMQVRGEVISRGFGRKEEDDDLHSNSDVDKERCQTYMDFCQRSIFLSLGSRKLVTSISWSFLLRYTTLFLLKYNFPSNCYHTILRLLRPTFAELQLSTHIWNYRRSPREVELDSRTVVCESEIVIQEDMRDDRFLDVRGIEPSWTGKEQENSAWIGGVTFKEQGKWESYQARLPYPQIGNFVSTSVSLATEPLRESSTKR